MICLSSSQYRTSTSYRELMDFTTRFHFYAPFNAMLVHIQMKGATYVAPAHRWSVMHQRDIKPGARPLVILQPMGPVMFVFDVAETEPRAGAPKLPPEILNPFEVRSGRVGDELSKTVRNAVRDGIVVEEAAAGSQYAGSIGVAPPGKALQFQTRVQPVPVFISVPRRSYLSLNKNHTSETRYARLVHELGHLYAGHLGTPNEKWWPDRRGLDLAAREFEAESICFLVCSRLGIDNPSEEYLSGYLNANDEVPKISLDCVMKAAGLIEQMGRDKLKARVNREHNDE